MRWLRDSFRHAHDAGVLARRPTTTPYLEGLLTNLLNPKVAVFYLTFLPQFIDPSRSVLAQSLLFAVVHSLMGIAWLSAYAYVVARLSRLFARGAMRRWLERVTGGVLVSLGLRLVLERR